ncbi:MAG: hypothetical protein EWV53_22565 [Microcystis panniformis Mp_MB_F_20051200_S9]|jgi:hypothetical protein|uniref:Uncharacterized protein n=5 Tax=Microcystis TaxID=1125 RepID=A0A841UZ45_MICAE|nr:MULTISPECIES: hypothetical protein [Microcystis]NCS28785.1 hypothetical protein [Microcystis aeruginosa F13-15]TRV06190.1 MAG: hypothetical protein EWV41_14505 [Microcystis wesenbergii Mw_MB_S_20031200_S109]TRV20547.1 MAG: hypothetical protein EWV88_16850 [Microcystis wesenbergii Mw_MB_S_20031200_S109D]TRV49114.1 MAG: hypothetical protein EWV43_09055 [Microcystis panniformis Mp_MB_F_20080800_S26D]TRV52842.1 MAG: hypothetical protein EWV42_07220 [Microcystis panniformis Mp_GB_SS_20050300_S99
MTNLNSIEQLSQELLDLDQVDADTGADLRQKAQEILAETSIDLPIREAIADSLSQGNQLLTLKTVGKEESY